MRLNIEHTTHYQYKDIVLYSAQYLRLTPRSSQYQQVIEWNLHTPEELTQTTDSFNNTLNVMTLDRPHQSIELTVKGIVNVEPGEDNDTLIPPLVFLRNTRLTKAEENITDLAKSALNTGSLSELEKLSRTVLDKMPYSPGSTDVSFDAATALATGKGVCQDHTHTFLACCRTVGIPARYVSGYLYTQDSAHVSSHAWAEVWVNDKWNTFDITNQSCTPNNHLKLAVGRDYHDACPVRGVRYGGGDESMHAEAYVSQLHNNQ